MSCRPVKAGEPWFEGCLTGVGDCAHATRPDLMQGGAMAVEVSIPSCLFAEAAHVTLPSKEPPYLSCVLLDILPSQAFTRHLADMCREASG